MYVRLRFRIFFPNNCRVTTFYFTVIFFFVEITHWNLKNVLSSDMKSSSILGSETSNYIKFSPHPLPEGIEQWKEMLS